MQIVIIFVGWVILFGAMQSIGLYDKLLWFIDIFMNMGISEWIGIISATLSLIVTIIIAILQMRQNNRLNKLEQQQKEKDEKRYNENIKAQVSEFISKYYKDRGLIPLCAIAAMYNDSYFYNRQMYNEFCYLPNELKNKILERCKLELCVSDDENIFSNCISALIKEHHKNFPNDKNIFYDNGKFIERSLTRYGRLEIQKQDYECNKAHITDILSMAYKDKNMDSPIELLWETYNFDTTSSELVCQLATVIAEYIAIYSNREKDSNKDYGSPGSYAGETIETMEDLFLLSLFEMYTNLFLRA